MASCEALFTPLALPLVDGNNLDLGTLVDPGDGVNDNGLSLEAPAGIGPFGLGGWLVDLLALLTLTEGCALLPVADSGLLDGD